MVKAPSIKMQLISLKVYFLRNQSYRDKFANQKQLLNCCPEKTTDLLQVTDKLYHIEITLILLPIKNSQATVDEK
jgi:hypothetical protein